MHGRMMLIVIALIAAQLATGNRLLHFCPITEVKYSSSNDSDDESLHAHLGSLFTDNHHFHGHHHGDHHHCGQAIKPAKAKKVSRGSFSSAGAAFLLPLDADQTPGIHSEAPNQDHSHTCSLLNAATFSPSDRIHVEYFSLAPQDFVLTLPGWQGLFAAVNEMPCALWPRPPDGEVDAGPTNARLASLCRFLL